MQAIDFIIEIYYNISNPDCYIVIIFHVFSYSDNFLVEKSDTQFTRITSNFNVNYSRNTFASLVSLFCMEQLTLIIYLLVFVHKHPITIQKSMRNKKNIHSDISQQVEYINRSTQYYIANKVDLVVPMNFLNKSRISETCTNHCSQLSRKM